VDPVNLNRFRKRKTAERDKRRADENRVRHGRTKEAKLLERRARQRFEAEIDHKKLEAPAGPDRSGLSAEAPEGGARSDSEPTD